MQDRPVTRDTRGTRTDADTAVIIAIIFAALIAALLLFGATLFNSGEKSVDMNKTQPNVEQPATGDKSAY